MIVTLCLKGRQLNIMSTFELTSFFINLSINLHSVVCYIPMDSNAFNVRRSYLGQCSVAE